MSDGVKGQHATRERRVLRDKLNLARYAPRYVKSGKRCFTDSYTQVAERRGMVIRRGEYFYLDLEFDETLEDKDLFSFAVVTTDYEQERLHREWHLKEKPTRFSDDESYHCPIQVRNVIIYKGSNKATAVFITSPDCIVAKYWITQVYINRSMEIKFAFDVKFSVSIIFNPFHSGDEVYMENAEERDEYVMQDEGCLYYGTSRKIGSKPWYFAQFEDPVLECAYLLLAKSELPLEQWGNPVEIARTLSALVNSNDDNGVLVGNWTGDYTAGVPPTEWKSSLPIISKYYHDQEPVCFGQCWVFSGLLTTFARALGIPARSVTTFDSAHDTNCNLIVDHFFNEDLTPLAEETADSIWNFHVWNDLWMARPDLADDGDYGGWQAVDATPQEQSHGVYRTGPSPLRAIKEGLVGINYDTPFVFAEVNACIKHWVKLADGSVREVFSDPSKVGQFISTKAIGSSERHDITGDYKYPEGTPEEDAAFHKAITICNMDESKGERRNDNITHHKTGLEILTDECLVIGNDLKIVMVAHNGHGKEKSFHYGFTAHLKKYNGKILKELAHQKGELVVAGKSSGHVEVLVKAADYSGFTASEEVGIEIVAAAVKGKDQLVKQTIVNLVMPELEINISGEVAQNKTFFFQCVFENTLPFDLHDGRFSIEGPGLRGESMIKEVGEVKQGDSAKCSITLNPVRAGHRKFIAAFNSKEIKGVVMEYPVYVEPDPDAIVEDVIIPVNASMLG